MEIFIFSITAIAPVLFTTGLGCLLRLRGLIDEAFITTLNKLCFRVFLPLMLFNNVHSIDFRAEFDLRLVGFAAGMVIAITILLALILPRFIKDRKRLAATINATFRSNYIIFATPIISSMFGEEGRVIAAMLSPIAIILFNFIGVIIMCYYTGDRSQSTGSLIKSTALDIVKNPLIIASILGALYAIINIPTPAFLSASFAMLGSMGTPMGLMLMGAQLDWKTLQGSLGAVFGGSLIRLVAIPLVGVVTAILAGFRGPELGTLFMLFGTPCSVTSVVMARNYNCAPRYAAQLVVLSTVLCMVTIFTGIVLLRAFAFM